MGGSQSLAPLNLIFVIFIRGSVFGGLLHSVPVCVIRSRGLDSTVDRKTRGFKAFVSNISTDTERRLLNFLIQVLQPSSFLQER